MSGALVPIVLAIFGLLGAGGGLYSLMTVRQGRQKIAAESFHIRAQADESLASTIKVLVGSASDLVEPLKRELTEARAEVFDLRKAVQELNGELYLASRIIESIDKPDMTMARLREMLKEYRDKS